MRPRHIQDEEHETPPRVPSQGHQHPTQKRLQQALENAEQDIFEKDDIIADLRHQLEQTHDVEMRDRDGEGDDAQADAEANGQQAPPPEDESTAACAAYSDMEGKIVRTAGRRCTMLHMAWMEGDCLFDTDVRNAFEAIISELEATRGEDGHDEADEGGTDAAAEFWQPPPRFEPYGPVNIVREIVAHLDIKLAKKWFEPWFKQQFKLGMRKMRSEAVNELADQRYLVFQLNNEEFGERHGQRQRGPGAKALFENDTYLWEPLRGAGDKRSEDERFIRSPVVIRASADATQLLLSSPSSVNSERRSAQAGSSRAEVWNVKAITPSILAFVCIVVHFVLSGDLSFDRVTRSSNYTSIYADTLKLLGTHYRKHRTWYNQAIALFNTSVLPNLHSDKSPDTSEAAGMTGGRKAFYLRMLEQDSEEEEMVGSEEDGSEKGGSENGEEGGAE